MMVIIKENADGEYYCFECCTQFTYSKEDIEIAKYPVSYNTICKRYDLHCPCCGKRITLNEERLVVTDIEEALKE